MYDDVDVSDCNDRLDGAGDTVTGIDEAIDVVDVTRGRDGNDDDGNGMLRR